jgi:hypothetical protein
MAEAVVDRFVHSYSWNNARDNLKRLQQLPLDVWTPQLAHAVKQAATGNNEVKDADIGFGHSSVGAEAVALVNSLPGLNPPAPAQ